MNMQHQDLANGKWFSLTLCEQLGNVGSEVGRAAKWKMKNATVYSSAIHRALELLDLTLADERWKMKEISQAREAVCEAYSEKDEFNSSLTSLEKYFNHFAFAARKQSGK